MTLRTTVFEAHANHIALWHRYGLSHWRLYAA